MSDLMRAQRAAHIEATLTERVRRLITRPREIKLGDLTYRVREGVLESKCTYDEWFPDLTVEQTAQLLDLLRNPTETVPA
jgi:hypothetical protein